MFGGSLDENDIFRKIVSIGYEFETHDIAKFSLHENGYSLINSDTNIRNLNYKIPEKTAEQVDDNNYIFYLEDDIKLNKRNNRKQNEVDHYYIPSINTRHTTSNQSNTNHSTTNSDRDDGDADFFVEYIDEPDSHDKELQLRITNDLGDSEFSDMISRCQRSKKSNNDMYIFKTKDREFSLKFYEITDCQTFSGVEYISTYFKPSRDSNIILDTFTDACRRIIEHLDDLVKIKGNLYMNMKNKFQKIGNLDHRYLFHKPNTNLYYLHTNDDKYTLKPSSLLNSVIVPQMTFGCKASDIISVMKQILFVQSSYKNGKQILNFLQFEYDRFVNVENITNMFITSYENETKTKLDDDFRSYLFMILYKLDVYLNYYDSENDDYFKSRMAFLSRHTNNTFYKLMVEWFQKHHKLNRKKAITQIHKLLKSSDEAIRLLYKISGKRLKDVKEKTISIEKSNEEKYGDPMESIISYFDFFENPLEDTSDEFFDKNWFQNDWLVFNKIDYYTTRMEIKDGILLTENRIFKMEIKTYIKNETNVKFSSRELKLLDLRKFVMYMTEHKKLKNYTRHNKTFLEKHTKTRRKK